MKPAPNLSDTGSPENNRIKPEADDNRRTSIDAAR